jgi:hypothetical protein
MQISSGDQRTAKITYNALPLRHKPHYIRLVETLSPYIYLHLSCQRHTSLRLAILTSKGHGNAASDAVRGQGSYSGIGRMQLK